MCKETRRERKLFQEEGNYFMGGIVLLLKLINLQKVKMIFTFEG